MMDRRSFLKRFMAAAPVAATNPVHFFAPIGGWTSEWIANPYAPSGRVDILRTFDLPDATYKWVIEWTKLSEITVGARSFLDMAPPPGY